MATNKCPTCHGDREVEFCAACENEVENCACDACPETRMQPCPECNGTGELESEG